MKSLSVLLLSTFLLSSTYTAPTPMPGALDISLSVNSINNLAQMMAMILPQYLIDGKSIEVNYTDSTFLYYAHIDNITINDLIFSQLPSIQYVPGTDTCRIMFAGININSVINAYISALHVVPLTQAQLNITNVTFEFELTAIDAPDQVHWQLNATSFFDLTDLNISTDSSIWNAVIDPMHGTFLDVAKKSMVHIKNLTDNFVQDLNAMLLNDTQFMVNLINEKFPLNLTMSRSPLMNSSESLISFFFDGTFYDVANKSNHVVENSVYAQRLSGVNSNQFFIHETMLSSMFFAISKELFPMSLNDTATTAQLLQLFPEIKDHYGPNLQTELQVVFDTSCTNGDFLRLTTENGIEIGEVEDGDVTLRLIMVASNETVKRQIAVEFQMALKAYVNFTLDNLFIYLNIPAFEIAGTKILVDNVGMYDREYDKLLNIVLKTTIKTVNNKWQSPFNFEEIDPIFGMLRYVIKNTHISPFFEDGFIYAGFSLAADGMLTTIQHRDRINESLGKRIANYISMAMAEEKPLSE